MFGHYNSFPMSNFIITKNIPTINNSSHVFYKRMIYFNNMINHIFKNIRKKSAKKNKYYSAPFLELYLQNRKNLIKNYVLDPDTRLIDGRGNSNTQLINPKYQSE